MSANTTQTNKLLLYQYEMLLLGQKDCIPTCLFTNSDKQNSSHVAEKRALNVCRFALESYLHWTPEESFECLTSSVINKLQLKNVLAYIDFPPEFPKTSREGLQYLVSLIYPQKYRFNKKEAVIQMYEKVLNREVFKYPKNWADGADGILRSRICLSHVISKYLCVSSIDELYRLFSGKSGEKIMTKYRLTPFSYIYEYPIAYLHESLDSTQRNEFLFQKYLFEARYNSL